MQEQRKATSFALQVTKFKARNLGQTIDTLVVHERHLWLNLPEMRDDGRNARCG